MSGNGQNYNVETAKVGFQGNSQAEKFAELIWNLFLGKVSSIC
jgi:hypothetical protein